MRRLREKYFVPGWLTLMQLGALAWLCSAANTASAQPANDDFANAYVIAGMSGTTNGDNLLATKETGEPDITLNAGGASVWYVWTAPSNGTAVFDTFGSDFDTLLGAFTGSSVDALTKLAANDDTIGLTSQVSFNVSAGTTYYIAVDGYNGDMGNIVLDWNVVPPPANDNFSDATALPNTVYGSIADTNLGASAESQEPAHAGFTATNSVWYKWVAPQDGEVELDTLGSSIDTVLGVYTGNSVSTLNQVAANDDLYPTRPRAGTFQDPQYTAAGQNMIFTNLLGDMLFGYGTYLFPQPYSGSPVSLTIGSGASGLRFNAKLGTTYYIAVDSKTTGGAFMLNWAYHSSGVFRFATENVDQFAGVPGRLLYTAAETEATRWRQGAVDAAQFSTTMHTTYEYDVPGVLVTITRVAGSSGRVTVDYTTVDGTDLTDSSGNPITLNEDFPAIAYTDYLPVSGTLTFDDFEMSKTIWIPIQDDGGIFQWNRDFGVVLSNPQNDLLESPDVSPVRLDPVYSQALVRILDADIDPRGPGIETVVVDDPNNPGSFITNTIPSFTPTNAVFNFQKAHYRVPEDVQNYWGGTPVTVYVNRSGTNIAGASINYVINGYYLGVGANINNEFPLEAGSDYATPDPASSGGVVGVSPDFIGTYTGTLTWGDKDFNPKPVTFTVYNDTLTEFNEDIHITLHDVVNGAIVPVGMVAETTVTILTDDQDPPAGSVDEFHNPDYSVEMVPPVNTEPRGYPGTDAGSQVNALVVQPDGKTIIGGNFSSYNGTQRHGLARINFDGQIDTTFDPGDGITIGDGNSSIKAIGLQSDGKVVVGGSFSSFNGAPCGNITRLNSDGSIDASFNTKAGAAANGTVRAILMRADGTIVIAGDFTQFNGTTRRYMARLNSDGSVDTTWDPANNFNGPVYAISPEAGTSISVSATAGGNELENTNIINVGASSGIVTIDYDMLAVPDDLRIYYGGTNNGVLIFDTGPVSGTNQIAVPFGPTNGLSFNYITIVMNQGNGTPGTFWSYTATVQTFAGDQLTVGGQFTSIGGYLGRDNIARVLGDGSLDLTFDAGVNGTVYAITTQPDGFVVAGGEFTVANGQTANHIARFSNTDGSLDSGFFGGTGTDGAVYALNYVGAMTGIYTNLVYGDLRTNISPDTIYVGGAFTTYNGTHRLGFARLNMDGTLDTTFLDTAYNQFAGLPRIYFNDAINAVYTSAVQSDGNVMIGGSFHQVGGGQANWKIRPGSMSDPNLWVSKGQVAPDGNLEPKTRDGIRNRYNVARLIGGSTAGPGNIGLLNSSYPTTKSQGFVYALLMRTNGLLGSASANFSVQPITAQAGPNNDYVYNGPAPLYGQTWDYLIDPGYGITRMHSDGLWGTNTVMQDVIGRPRSEGLNGPASVIVSINNNDLNPGDLNAGFQLANPAGADQFYLGGVDIPVGVALGRSYAPLNIVDDNKKAGTFGFSSPSYTGTTTTVIPVVRTNGSFNTIPIMVDYATMAGDGTTNGVDYTDVSGTLTFNDGETAKAFSVPIIASNYISAIEKTVNLHLSNLRGASGGILGLSNSVLRIINPNFEGFLNFSATNYVTNLNANFIAFTVTRTVGNKGSLDVKYATFDGTAVNGTDYVGTTNTLHWNSGDSSPQMVTIPLVNNGNVGPTKSFGAYLFNPTTNGVAVPSILGTITNTTLTISNDNSYGTFQFSRPSYVVNESGGYALLTVTRTTAILSNATVNFSTADGTAFANTNYVATNGTLTFAPGQLAATFKVAILNDSTTNALPFYFNAILSNPSTGTSLGSPTNAIVNIVDTSSFNRPPGAGDVTFNPPTINADVLALAVQTNGQIIAGGDFTRINGVPQGRLARFNADGSLDTAYAYGLAGADGAVNTVVNQTDNRTLIGGAFSSVNGVVRNFVARVNTDGSLDTSFNPGSGADNVVFSAIETFINGTRRLYIGGAFTSYRSVSRMGVVRVNDNGTLDTAFTGTVNGIVYALAAYPTNSVYAGKVVVGGSFTTANGVSQGGIARFNQDGSRDSTFAGYVSGTVRSVLIQDDGGIVVGGEFTNANGVAVNRLARFNNDGSLDTNFIANLNGGANNTVNTLALQADNRIVVGGQFTQCDGVTRNRITRLLPTGAVDPTINFGTGANGDVNAVVVQPADQMILLGGGFTQYNDQPPAYLTRIYGGSETGSGSFEFTTASFVVDEDNAVANISIRRNGGLSGPNADGTGDVLVDFATSNGSAVAGVNYTTVSSNVIFPPGEVLKTVAVPITRDYAVTSNLTVNLTLSSPTSPAILGDQPTSVLTIVNVDGAVSFLSSAYSVAKNNPLGAAIINIVRIGTSSGTCSVDFYTTTNGTAVPGLDYTPTNTTVVFAPGETNKTVYVAITNNAIFQGNRTVGMVLSNAVNTLLYSPSNATLTIVDTVYSAGQLCFATNAFLANEGDGTTTITVLRTNGTSGAISAYYYTVPGTALPGVNYTTVSNIINFADGQTSATFAVPLVDNSIAQGNVSLTLGLVTNLTSGTTLFTPSNAVLTISDNDSGFIFAATTNTFRETAGPAVVTVLRVGPTNTAASVSYATHDGTAVSGTNYVGSTNTLAFAIGQASKSILIPLVYDPRVTGDMTFTTTLFGNSAGTQIGIPSTNTVVIQDADAGLSFTNDTMTVARNVGAALITVVCSNPSVEPVIVSTNTVPLSVQYATSDGTGVAGSDYVATSGTLLFTNGMGTNYFYVPLINVGQVVGDKTFNVRLFNPTAPGQVVAPSNLVVTITDGNAAFRFSKPTYSIYKSGGAITIDVIRTGLTNSAAQVDFQATNGTAIAGVHYYPTNGTLFFTNGVTKQSFTVGVIDTASVQPDETVLLQLFNPSNAILVSPSAATLTIRDNSGSYVLPAGSALVSESGAGAPNGAIDPGETVTMLFGFRDAGGLDVTNLIATLIATNGVTPSPNPASQVYGLLRSGSHSVSRQFVFTAAGTNGQQILATFQLKDGTQDIGMAVFGYTLGSWQARFTNSDAILINDKAVASPYPSIIAVSNVVGTVIKATATLTNVSHSSVKDIDVLLVSPEQSDTLLMAHVGSFGVTITNATLTFDDAAATMLPSSGAITTGTNKPSAYLPVPAFP